MEEELPPKGAPRTTRSRRVEEEAVWVDPDVVADVVLEETRGDLVATSRRSQETTEWGGTRRTMLA